MRSNNISVTKMFWQLLSCLLVVVIAVLIVTVVVYHYLLCSISKLSEIDIQCKSGNSEVLTSEPEVGRSYGISLKREENKKREKTENVVTNRQAKSIDSEDYWASDESGEGSSGRKFPVKKPRGKKGSQARFGATDSSHSNASDGQSSERVLSSPQKAEQKLSFLDSGTDRDSGESDLHGKSVNYSGKESPRSSDSESVVPLEDHTPHVSMQ